MDFVYDAKYGSLLDQATQQLWCSLACSGHASPPTNSFSTVWVRGDGGPRLLRTREELPCVGSSWLSGAMRLLTTGPNVSWLDF